MGNESREQRMWLRENRKFKPRKKNDDKVLILQNTELDIQALDAAQRDDEQEQRRLKYGNKGHSTK